MTEQAKSWKWYNSLGTTAGLSFVSSVSFSRGIDASHPYWWATFVACVAITIHRLVLIGNASS